VCHATQVVQYACCDEWLALASWIVSVYRSWLCLLRVRRDLLGAWRRLLLLEAGAEGQKLARMTSARGKTSSWPCAGTYVRTAVV
jgi:hypothetical protein